MPVLAETAPVYLDYAATTPVDPRVAVTMAEYLTTDGIFGNPASVTHAYGREAARHVEAARADVAALIGAEAAQIVFTSGATESNNLAVSGISRGHADRGRHLVTSRIEHRAVLDPCRRLEKEGWSITWLEPDRSGLFDPASLQRAIRPDTQLVSLIHAHNEIGTVQDLAALGGVCRERGVLFHSDAAQSVGKLPLDVGMLPVDLLSFTAHKLYGPKGIGALYVRPAARARLAPLLHGGGQEQGLRSGTLANHQIAGFGAAARLALAEAEVDARRIGALRDLLWERLAGLDGVLRNGDATRCVPGILNVSIAGVEGESLVAAMPELALSTGSACSSAAREPSYVLRALGRSTELAESSLRLSLGRFSTEADVERAARSIAAAIRRLRALAP